MTNGPIKRYKSHEMLNSNTKEKRASRLDAEADKLTEQADRARNLLPLRARKKRKAAKAARDKADKTRLSATSKHKRYENQK